MSLSAYTCLQCTRAVLSTTDAQQRQAQLRVCAACLPGVEASLAGKRKRGATACDACGARDSTVRDKPVDAAVMQTLCFRCAHLCGVCGAGEASVELGRSVYTEDDPHACLSCRYAHKTQCLMDASTAFAHRRLPAPDTYACVECRTRVGADTACTRRARQLQLCGGCYTRGFATALGATSCTLMQRLVDTRIDACACAVAHCACDVCRLPDVVWRLCDTCMTYDPSCTRGKGDKDVWKCFTCRRMCFSCDAVVLAPGGHACSNAREG